MRTYHLVTRLPRAGRGEASVDPVSHLLFGRTVALTIHRRPAARRQIFHVHAQDLAAQEQDRAERLILRAGRPPMPLCALEEIDEVNAEGLVHLAHLPVLEPAVPLQFFAEPSNLIPGATLRWSRRCREKSGAAAQRRRSADVVTGRLSKCW